MTAMLAINQPSFAVNSCSRQR